MVQHTAPDLQPVSDAHGRDEGQLAPHLLQTVRLVLISFGFDATALRAALPAELEPSDDRLGFALFYTSAPSGGFPPSSGFYVGAFLNGRDAPDGSPGVFVVDGYYSNDEQLDVAKKYSSRFDRGWAEIDEGDGLITGRGGPEGETAVEFVVRRRDGAPPLMLGTHQYFGERPGGLTTYSLAFAARLIECETVRFGLADTASPRLRLLDPARVTRAVFVPGAPLYFSKPRPIGHYEHITAPDAAHAAVLDVLSYLGRAAVVAGVDGRVYFSNPKGREALGPMLNGDQLETSDREQQAALLQLIRDAANARPPNIVRGMALHRADGEVLIVRAANYRGGWNGQPTAVLVLGKAKADDRQSGSLLELLGLTPSEARVAAAIADGRSAREAATSLGISENTVRSTLKLIYAKLGVSNKTELANILAQF